MEGRFEFSLSFGGATKPGNRWDPPLGEHRRRIREERAGSLRPFCLVHTWEKRSDAELAPQGLKTYQRTAQKHERHSPVGNDAHIKVINREGFDAHTVEVV